MGAGVGPGEGGGAHGSFAGALGAGRAPAVLARSAIGQVADILGRGDADRAGTLVEVSAASGSVTGQLVRAGVRLLAVEPLDDPRRQLARALPSVPVVAGVHGRLPLRDAVAAGVLTTDPSVLRDVAGADEVARILAPGGTVVLLVDAAEGDPIEPLDRSLPGPFGDPEVTVHRHRRPDGSSRVSIVVAWRHAG
jgi:hypothetical protein